VASAPVSIPTEFENIKKSRGQSNADFKSVAAADELPLEWVNGRHAAAGQVLVKFRTIGTAASKAQLARELDLDLNVDLGSTGSRSF